MTNDEPPANPSWRRVTGLTSALYLSVGMMGWIGTPPAVAETSTDIFVDQSALYATVTGPLLPGTTTIELPPDAVIREDGSACATMPVTLSVNRDVVGRLLQEIDGLHHIGGVELKPTPISSSVIRLDDGFTTSTIEICGSPGESVVAELTATYKTGIGSWFSLPLASLRSEQIFTFAPSTCVPNVRDRQALLGAWTLTNEDVQYAPQVSWVTESVSGPVPQPGFPDAVPLGYSCAAQGVAQFAVPRESGAGAGYVLVSKEAAECNSNHTRCDLRLGNQTFNLKAKVTRQALNCTNRFPLPARGNEPLALAGQRSAVDPVRLAPQSLNDYLCVPTPKKTGKYEFSIEKRGKVTSRGSGDSYIRCQYFSASNTYYCGVYEDGDYTVDLDSTLRRSIVVNGDAVQVNRGKRAR